MCLKRKLLLWATLSFALGIHSIFFSEHPAVAALVLVQSTFETTSGLNPDDFQFTSTDNPIVKMEVYNRSTADTLGTKISTDPAAGTYPVKAGTPLDLSIIKPNTTIGICADNGATRH
jgi:hypothetical protein